MAASSAPADPATLEHKGTNFVGPLKALERLRGAAAHEAVLERLTGELGELLRTNALLVGGWYPTPWFGELLQTIVDVTGESPTFIQELSRSAVQQDHRTLFRAMRLVLSVDFALPTAMRLNRRYVSGGEIELLEGRTGHIHFRFTGFHGYTTLMWNEYIGGVEGTISAMGGTDVSSKVTDQSPGTLSVIFRYTPRA